MKDPLDSIIDTRIFNLECVASYVQSGNAPPTYDQLKGKAYGFFALKETKSSNGNVFADRVSKVHEKVKNLLPKQELEGLEDFTLRQKSVALGADIDKAKVCG